jgi:hypothetical protein
MILLNMVMVYLILKIFTLIHHNISEHELKVKLLYLISNNKQG